MAHYSAWRVDEFADQNGNNRRHVIDFDQTSEKDGFRWKTKDERDQLGEHEAWQFQVCSREDWRIHGILIDGTF